MADFNRLFERTYIGKHGVKNRFVMAPMGLGPNFASGCIEETGIEYYAARAKGGTGMINVGFQIVTNKTDPFTAGQYGVGTPLQEMGWARLCDRIHGYGSSVMVQLSCGLGRNAQMVPGGVNVSASENPCFFDPSSMTRALSIEEIHEIVHAFGVAAGACKRAGVDVIEIHGHVGYLLDQFMTPLWNRRGDEYGAQNFENKMRFVTEVYQACRKAVGPDYPIAFRMVIEHKIPGGRTKEESAEIIRYLDGLGVDAFDVDLGCYDAYEWVFPTCYMPDGCMMDEAGAFAKSITQKPVLTAGAYTPETALKAVEEGKTDFIVIGRGLLADPEFAGKLQEGRREEIRPCIKCNRYCLSCTGSAKDSSCSVNPAVLKEALYGKITKSETVKKVVIVCGGVGGLEAARVAALKGHSVTLYEKSGRLGGQLIPASAPAFKSRLSMLLNYYEVQMEKLGVRVMRNTEITAQSPELAEADKIIVATGAVGFLPPIPGIHTFKVLEVIDAHTGDQSRIGQKVLIAGGGPSGCDCAIELAMSGKDVTIVEMVDRLYPTGTLDNRFSVLRRVKEEKIRVFTGTKVKEFNDKGAVVENADGIQELEADTIIVAMGTRPNQKTAKEILDRYTNAQLVGDCRKVGQVGEAVQAGFFAAWTMD
ncbi:MAG: FAD-dependent oxidoreductase [Lachnospiraceae bacterium]|nr:FAD-dependent oxidoreductase [Lachnospiraceae bacterium]